MNQREHYYWLPQLIKHDHNIREIFVEKKKHFRGLLLYYISDEWLLTAELKEFCSSFTTAIFQLLSFLFIKEENIILFFFLYIYVITCRNGHPFTFFWRW